MTFLKKDRIVMKFVEYLTTLNIKYFLTRVGLWRQTSHLYVALINWKTSSIEKLTLMKTDII